MPVRWMAWLTMSSPWSWHWRRPTQPPDRNADRRRPLALARRPASYGLGMGQNPKSNSSTEKYIDRKDKLDLDQVRFSCSDGQSENHEPRQRDHDALWVVLLTFLRHISMTRSRSKGPKGQIIGAKSQDCFSILLYSRAGHTMVRTLTRSCRRSPRQL
jgi:hypothetical protein